MFDNFPPTYIALAVAAVIALALLQRVPVLGRLIRLCVSVAVIAVLAVVIAQRAPLDPYLGKLVEPFHLDRQQVSGGEVRIKMAANGHFFANVRLNGVKRRMLIDSGATVTALSSDTAAAAGLRPSASLIPVVLQTANGAVRAEAATIAELRLGNITAWDLKVVVSPAFGDMNVLGMNFLSKLKSWRVEEGTLILVPHHPQPETGT
jgi:aspartyl protease family protein